MLQVFLRYILGYLSLPHVYLRTHLIVYILRKLFQLIEYISFNISLLLILELTSSPLMQVPASYSTKEGETLIYVPNLSLLYTGLKTLVWVMLVAEQISCLVDQGTSSGLKIYNLFTDNLR